MSTQHEVLDNLPDDLLYLLDSTDETELAKKAIKSYAEKDRILLQMAVERNLILLGRIRSGKSTFLEVLKRPDHLADQMSLYAETRDPKLHRFTVKYQETNYNINVMDTPGLFEITSSEDQRRTNEQLKGIIKKCIEWEFTRIHLIVIAITVETGVNKEDIEAITQFSEMFGDVAKKIVLLITRSEGYSEKEKRDFISQFDDLPQLKTLKNVLDLEGGILFSGCLASRHLSSELNAKTNLARVMVMRNKFYSLLFSKGECTYIKDIASFKSEQEAEMENLKRNVTTLQEEKRHVEEEKESLMQNIATLQEEKRHVEEEKENLKRNIATLQEEKRHVEEEKENLKRNIATLQEEKRHVEEEKAVVQRNLASVTAEKVAIQQSLQNPANVSANVEVITVTNITTNITGDASYSGAIVGQYSSNVFDNLKNNDWQSCVDLNSNGYILVKFPSLRTLSGLVLGCSGWGGWGVRYLKSACFKFLKDHHIVGVKSGNYNGLSENQVATLPVNVQCDTILISGYFALAILRFL
eukprot:TRINITY_DN3764_c0_g2_i1.p1 TRINITY_DN3764_c0_g2~~TRINITY_DN3764_c0_g2_i1.p1  ORF type:complete len:526 (-),score=114.25 TRINITY_DN3764_c0_g2_i1:85-1662(-)